MSGIVKDLGPCQVWFNSASVGKTFGDVIFRDTGESRPVHEDEKGVTPVDSIRVGRNVEVEVPMTRQSLAELAIVIPGASVDGTLMDVDNQVGVSRYDAALELIIKPIVDNVVSASINWLTISLASPEIDAEVVYNNEGQRVFKVIFKAFPDPTTGKIYSIGSA